MNSTTHVVKIKAALDAMANDTDVTLDQYIANLGEIGFTCDQAQDKAIAAKHRRQPS